MKKKFKITPANMYSPKVLQVSHRLSKTKTNVYVVPSVPKSQREIQHTLPRHTPRSPRIYIMLIPGERIIKALSRMEIIQAPRFIRIIDSCIESTLWEKRRFGFVFFLVHCCVYLFPRIRLYVLRKWISL